MLKAIIREVTPPILLRGAKFLNGTRNTPAPMNIDPPPIPYSMFNGDYPSFEAAAKRSVGYADENAGESAARRLKEFLEREPSVEIDSRFQQIHSALSTVREWSQKSDLSVVDFGGGNGGYYFRLREFFPKNFFRWSVVETDTIVENFSLLVSGSLEFLKAIPTNKRFDVAIICGSLQYVTEPYDVLRRLASQTDWIILARVPVQGAQQDKYMVQTVPVHIHEGSMPVTIFSEEKLLSAISSLGHIKQTWSVPADEGSLAPIGARSVGYLVKISHQFASGIGVPWIL